MHLYIVNNFIFDYGKYKWNDKSGGYWLRNSKRKNKPVLIVRKNHLK